MFIPITALRLAHRMLPARLRIRLRRSAIVRTLAASVLRGTAHCPFPNSAFELFFDRYRNIGFGLNISEYEQEQQEIVRLLSMKSRPNVVWDIGANIGIWSLFWTTICGTDSEVRCFEPDPENLSYLRLNMKRNRLSNWVVRPVAVSSRDGQALFYSDPVSGATGSLEAGHDFIGRHFKAEGGAYSVTLITVDSEIADGASPPQFMKIDVEGHELDVLEGARNTLRDHRPNLILEVSRSHDEICELLKDADYQIFNMNGMKIDRPEFNTLALPSESSLVNRG